ncbi:hypothetical protein Tco_1228729 [Tanacetum coccineum]
MSRTVPPIPPPLGTSSGSMGNPNVNRVDTMPTTNDPINTTTTTNVSQSVVDENLPQLLDSRGGSHVTNVPNFDKDDFTTTEIKFNAFKSLEGEKVNGTFTKLTCLLNDLQNNNVSIPQAEDEESVSSKDKGTTRIRAFMAIAEDEPSVGKTDARSGQWVDITMKKVHRLLSMIDGDERKHVLDYTHVDLYYVEDQRKNNNVSNKYESG